MPVAARSIKIAAGDLAEHRGRAPLGDERQEARRFVVQELVPVQLGLAGRVLR
jgi:hypothetical protein